MALGFCKLSQIQDIATSVKNMLGLDKIKFSEIAPSLNDATFLGKVSYTSPTFTITEDERHANMDNYLISRWGLWGIITSWTGPIIVEVGNPMNDVTVKYDRIVAAPDISTWTWGGEYAFTGQSYGYHTSSGFSGTTYVDGRWDYHSNVYSEDIGNEVKWYGFNADSFTVRNCRVALRKCFALPYADSWAKPTSSAAGYDYRLKSKGRIDLLVFSNCTFADDCTMAFDHNIALTKIVFEDCDSSAITNVTDMFDACTGLTSLRISPNWLPNESVTKFNLSSCPLDYESCLDVFENIATKSIASTLSIKSTTKALMSDDEIKIATDKGWTISTY
jgi:hypothetical protein